jgi:hypothetical protein
MRSVTPLKVPSGLKSPTFVPLVGLGAGADDRGRLVPAGPAHLAGVGIADHGVAVDHKLVLVLAGRQILDDPPDALLGDGQRVGGAVPAVERADQVDAFFPRRIQGEADLAVAPVAGAHPDAFG